ncbi:MAG: hypothetical protein NWE84_04935 [Candidatus Bathyarchaeota archaeon]|nr:hypothetical protein [Candidatus Bathyarchaeota archaeon]
MQKLVPLLTDNPGVGKNRRTQIYIPIKKAFKKDFAKIKAAVAQLGKY